MKRLSILLVLSLIIPTIKAQHQVTIFDSSDVFMEASGLSHVNCHKRIQMKDYTGCKNNSVVKIDYDPQSAYVDITKVLVHRTDGTTDTLIAPIPETKPVPAPTNKKGKKATSPTPSVPQRTNAPIYDYIAPARLIYWGASQKMVEIGHLEPGDEIEYWTYRKGFTYALLADDDTRYIPPMKGHFYDIVPFWSEQPIREKVYRVNVPTEKNLQYKVYNGNIEPEVNAEGDRTIYTFTMHDIKPIAGEPAMLAHNDIEPKLLLSTSPNWEAKSMWFYGVNEDYGSFNSTPELQAKVDELLKGAHSEMDTISILTHWVADNMRYAGISMGEGEGYTLHNAQMNFTDRCGVCKDKAGLLIAMLRAAGFKAYAAMTMAGERIDRIPADQFNHSVCVVQHHDGQYELLDPTWVPNVRELWSSAEQQQGYLMGLPEGADLMETPISNAKNHYIKINAHSAIDKEGTLSGEITITAEGQSDNAVRRAFVRQADWDNAIEIELLKIAPQAEVLKIQHTNPDEYLKQPVSITYTFRIKDYATMGKKELIFTPLSAKNLFSRAMTHLGMSTDIETRQYPFADRCSRYVAITEDIKLPQKYKAMRQESEKYIDNPTASFVCQYQLNKDTLHFAETVLLTKRIYQADEWEDFRKVVNAQKETANTPVILTK